MAETLRWSFKQSPVLQQQASKESKETGFVNVKRNPLKMSIKLPSTEEKEQVRAWADGCFDLTHWGHMNALRQAKSLADYLVVGVHSDEDIIKHKGPPVMNEQERYKAVRACKWVDEVVEAAPYVTQLSVLEDHNIDFCVHGDDITTDENGVDCYQQVKDAGRYKSVPRTEGVSTTQLVGRMILMTNEHLRLKEKKDLSPKAASNEPVSDTVIYSPYTGQKGLLPTTRRIVAFSEGQRVPTKDDVIVYIDGAFDLFHAGHIEALQHAKQMGTYLIVGVHTDQVVNDIRGRNLPIMNLHERVLGVLACRYVDEVVIGAPWEVTKEMVDQMKIKIVAIGTFHDYPNNAPNPYKVPLQLGIAKPFESLHTDLTTDMILDRILKNLRVFEGRNKKKQEGEIAYMESQTDSAEKS